LTFLIYKLWSKVKTLGISPAHKRASKHCLHNEVVFHTLQEYRAE